MGFDKKDKEEVAGNEVVDMRNDLQKYKQQKTQIENSIAQLKQQRQEIDRQLDHAHALLNGTIGAINYIDSKLRSGT